MEVLYLPYSHPSSGIPSDGNIVIDVEFKLNVLCKFIWNVCTNLFYTFILK